MGCAKGILRQGELLPVLAICEGICRYWLTPQSNTPLGMEHGTTNDLAVGRKRFAVFLVDVEEKSTLLNSPFSS